MPRSQSTATTTFRYVNEQDDEFIALFPHRFDYIYARHPEPNQSPNWHTESRYPLSDRQLQQGEYLFGVRFGKQTQYCLLDIDADSPYHPQQDIWATHRLLAALEPLGLVSYVACTSSDSGGLHIYFPFAVAKTSWELAAVVATALQNAGFHLKPGWLELFPNPRPYLPQTTPSLFHAHRLPLQMGSYLLNREFHPVWTDPRRFVQHWRCAQQQNQWNVRLWQRLLKQVQGNRCQVSGKAEKFLNDLNTEIEMGWTGHGQTNRLLGRIALRAYVFDHILQGGQPLSGAALVERIITVAGQLPGYHQWCRHQHELRQRAEEWARCVEGSRYFPYQSKNGVENNSHNQINKKTVDALENVSLANRSLTWNQQRAEQTRERIRLAIADLLTNNLLPATATIRYRALLGYGIGGASLYRHRDLWHPNYLHELTPFEHTEITNSLSGEVGKNCERHTELSTDCFDQQIIQNSCTGLTDNCRVIQTLESLPSNNSVSVVSNLFLSSQLSEAITRKTELVTQIGHDSQCVNNQQIVIQNGVNFKGSVENHKTESNSHLLHQFVSRRPFDCAVGASNGQDQTSLFPVIDGDTLSRLAFSDRAISPLADLAGDSVGDVLNLSHLLDLDDSLRHSVPPIEGGDLSLAQSFTGDADSVSCGDRGLALARRIVQQVRQAIAANREVNRQAGQHRKVQLDAMLQQQANRAYLAQMQAYLASGDPILMAEARSWLGNVVDGE